MRSLRVTAVKLSLVTLLLPAGSLAAQARRIDPDAAAAALARLSGDATIRLESTEGRRIVGRFGGLSAGSIRVGQNGASEAVDLDRLSAAWVRQRHTKTGAVLGGVAGLGAGIFIGLLANSACEADDCRGAGPYLKASAIFIPVGAVVGAAVGAAIPRWRRILP